MLLKSTLLSLPTYYLSLFSIPSHLSNRLEKLQRISYGADWGMSSSFTWWIGLPCVPNCLWRFWGA
jgi:hypothetical protein